MEITEVEVLPYEFPLAEAWDERPSWYREWHNAVTGWDGTVEGRQECVVKVHTDAGITGVGSADTSHRDARVVASVIENVLRPVVVGEDPTDVERLWGEMWTRCGSRIAGASGIGYGAIGGIDIACWDILGKKLGAPVYELLGGDEDIPVRPYIGTYTLGWRELDDVDSIVEEARHYVDQGYEAIKIRGGRALPHEGDVATVRALRAEFPPDELEIMIDVNGGYDRQEAVRMAEELEPYDIFWLEDPFGAYSSSGPNFDELAAYQDRIDIDVFLGGGPSSRELTRFLGSGATTNLVSLSTEHGGGISEAMKAATLLHSWGITAAGIAHEPLASLPLFHVWKAVPPGLVKGSYVEYDPSNSCWDELLTDPPELVDGELVLSDEPGLGTDVNDEFIENHPLPEGPSTNAM
ncbi:MAG: mandelate racemase/muconate lactonizing enzyme family protein [Haloferacaceae archaeon]